MTMIETIARASHDFFAPIYKLPPFDDLPAESKSVMYQHAKAILTAMREPSQAMADGVDAGPVKGSGSDACAFWRALVDTALEEKPA